MCTLVEPSDKYNCSKTVTSYFSVKRLKTHAASPAFPGPCENGPSPLSLSLGIRQRDRRYCLAASQRIAIPPRASRRTTAVALPAHARTAPKDAPCGISNGRRRKPRRGEQQGRRRALPRLRASSTRQRTHDVVLGASVRDLAQDLDGFAHQSVRHGRDNHGARELGEPQAGVGVGDRP